MWKVLGEHFSDPRLCLDMNGLKPWRLADHLAGAPSLAIDEDARVAADSGTIECKAVFGKPAL